MIANTEDTIVGIATAMGEAGVNIIRISGKKAISIADKLFSSKNSKSVCEQKNYTLAYGWIHDDTQVIDEVLLSVMRKPNSFTAEDVVEINTHGGSFVTRVILNLVLKAGARLSQPGEFTQRAFLNGRIDLTQSEAVNDLIQAKTWRSLDQAINQLRGNLYHKIDFFKKEIAWVLALVNATIDFSEEDEVFNQQEACHRKLSDIAGQLRKMIDGADAGRIIREGFRVTIVGEPNVGKSSIMNALLKEERAIVTAIPGTTRDIIEEMVHIEGIPITLTDTAGVRSTEDLVEKEGIKRAYTAIDQSDLVLWVIDSFSPSYDMLHEFEEKLEQFPCLVVFNKRDLVQIPESEIPAKIKQHPILKLSSINELDITLLREKISQFAIGKYGLRGEEILLTNLRQKSAAEKALQSIGCALETLEQEKGEECLAVDLGQVLTILGEIVGETTPDEMLHHIFSQFCIGK